MKSKYTNSSVRTRQITFVFALTMLAVTSYSQNTYTFGYTGAAQTVALTAGNYEVECWGANGGNNLAANTGGKGGYSTGTFVVSSAGTHYVYVGGRGITMQTASTPAPGGFNGGGNSGAYSSLGNACGSGGGASHVASANGLLSSLSGNTAAVIVVAGGGGGGGANHGGSNTQDLGAHAGGLVGGNGLTGTYGGFGGTQTAGGSNMSVPLYSGTMAQNGSFGQGGSANLSNPGYPAYPSNTGGGGGGGWYGGAAALWEGGGGGSGYIGGLTTGTTIGFGQPGYVANPDPNGDGYVIIKELCSISLSVAGLGSNGELCEGNVITISTDAVSNYSWTDGGIGPVLVAAPSTSTVYGLTAMSPSNCITSAQVSITVNPRPVLNATASAQAICLGESVVLSAGGADSYSWSTSATSPTITLSPNQTTTYSITGTYTLTGCERTEMVTVNVLKPTVAISGNSVICKGNTTTLTAFGDGATFYSWSTGSPGQAIIDAPSTHSIYAVTAHVTTLNVTCSALSTFTVLVNPLPNIVAHPDRFSVCTGETVEFSATGGVNYSWSWQSETSSAPTFVVAGELPGKISVNVTGTDANGCSKTVSTAAQVNECVGINETLPASEIITVYPNPSQGNISITVNPAYSGSQLELQMLNETGQLVRTIILNEDNEYKANLTELNTGLYFLTGNDGSRRISGKIIISR